MPPARQQEQQAWEHHPWGKCGSPECVISTIPHLDVRDLSLSVDRDASDLSGPELEGACGSKSSV